MAEVAIFSEFLDKLPQFKTHWSKGRLAPKNRTKFFDRSAIFA